VEAHENPSTYILPGPVFGSVPSVRFEQSEENTWNVTSGDPGYLTIEYDLMVSGPLGILGAPHLNGIINITINEDGSIDYSFFRDGFPWAEAYYYDDLGGVQTIFQDPAVRGNPYDLYAIEPNQGTGSKRLQQAQKDVLRYGDPLVSNQSSWHMGPEPW
jgi:hypothetical protein